MRPVHRRLLGVARAVLGEVEPRPATPEQIAAAEARLGRPLPPGYRAFLAEVGWVSWPLVIGNLVDFEGDWPAHLAVFADDGSGNVYGFDLRGKKGRELPIDFWDHEDPALDDEPGPPERFEDWLEERLGEEEQRTAQAQGPAAEPPPEASEDEELALAERLIERLVASGQLETTRGFSSGAVARRMADVWASPARMLAILMDREDVIEVYVSEEELAALQAELR